MWEIPGTRGNEWPSVNKAKQCVVKLPYVSCLLDHANVLLGNFRTAAAPDDLGK